MDAFFRRKYLTLFPEATPTPGALKIIRVTLTLSGGWGPPVDPLRLTADSPVNAPGTPLPRCQELEHLYEILHRLTSGFAGVNLTSVSVSAAPGA